MALSGTHIVCAYIGGQGAQSYPMPLLAPPVWSRTMPAAGVTPEVAPQQVAGHDISFEIRASADIYVACGPNPDAGQTVGTGKNTARILVPAGTTRNIFAYPGDRVAWTPA